MPPSNTANPINQPQHARKKTNPVIPAIPYALSKPRPAKQQPKQDNTANETNLGANEENSVDQVPGVPVVDQAASDTVNGFHNTVPLANGDRDPSTAQIEDEVQSPDTLGNDPTPVPLSATLDIAAQQANGHSSLPTSRADVDHGPKWAHMPLEQLPVRPVRTELPPAFVPSAEQFTPRSATSSHSNHAPPLRSHAHPAHPSTNSIIFGGRDS